MSEYKLEPVTESQIALSKLQLLRQNRSAAEYSLQFKTIIPPLRYNDPPPMFYFYGGIQRQC